MSKIMQGRRVDYDESKGYELPHLKSGEYGKDKDGNWWVKAPNGFGAGAMITGHNKSWKVIEHEDGTITVSPSLGFCKKNGGYGYHGFLEKGVWREC